MNKQVRNYIAVGFVVALLTAAGVFGYKFISSGISAAKDKPLYVVFDNAQGIAIAEPVQLAGIKIGQVNAVDLTDTNRARLTLGIGKEFRIPEGSQFTIQAGLLGNSRHVEVKPAANSAGEIAAGATIEGVSTSPLDETLAESKKLVVQGQQLVATFQEIVADPVRQKNLDTIIANSAAISGDLRRTTATLPSVKLQLDLLLADLRTTLASGRRISRQVESLAGTGNKIAGNANKLTTDLDATLNENRRSLRSLIASADEAATAVAGLTGDVRATLNDPTLRKNLEELTGNLQTTTANVASLTKRLDTITAQFETLASDPSLTGDLKTTLANVRDTTANLKDATASLRNITGRVETIRIPGERRPPTTPPGTQTPPPAPTYFSTTSLLEPGFVFDALYDTTDSRLRSDANYTLLSGRNRLYRLGLFDATERNQLNLQIGQYNGLPASFAYRAGVVAGKLGGGFDLRLGPVDFRADVFDPNRLQLNLRAKGYLNRESSIFGGVDGVGRDNRATLGVQLRY